MKIVLLEDDHIDAELIEEELVSSFDFPIEFCRVHKRDDFLEKIETFTPDLILSDYRMPQYNGLEAIQDVKDNGLDIPIIIVTGSLSEETAADSIRSGAWDYVVKERLFRLPNSVKNVLELKIERERQRETEEQLKVAQKMEAVGLLASGIAHDFNNSIGGILGIASLLRSEIDDRHEFTEQLELIIKECERSSSLTRQLLKFSGQDKDSLSVMNANDCINDAIHILKHTLRKNIQIEQNLEENLWNIMGNSVQIHQMLLNVAINARDAMPEGGTLTFTSSNLDITQDKLDAYELCEPGEYIHIQISDTGTGMSPEVREKILTPFFTTKEPGLGTGIGMAVVSSILKSHKGDLRIETELGKGSVLHFYFKRTIESIKDVSDESVPETVSMGSVLIIDDNPVIRKVSEKILEKYGYVSLSAKDGTEGVKQYKKHRPDIVILDLILPGISSLEVLRQLKKIEPNVKILVSSGLIQEGEAADLLQEGALAFMQKPFDAKRLAVNVGRFI